MMHDSIDLHEKSQPQSADSVADEQRGRQKEHEQVEES